MFVAEALDRSGLWVRAGMAGVVVGIDMENALAGLPSACDRDFARRLFVTAELFYVAAINRESDDSDG